MKVGLTISLDYWWSTFGVDEDDKTYQSLMDGAHERSAERLLKGCLGNGGLYVKLGQGLVSLNHILPPQYIATLKVRSLTNFELLALKNKTLGAPGQVFDERDG
jgi:aarF domain-containing kinase